MATDTLQPALASSHRRLARRRKLNTLIFFVTSRCNATCDTCFYWEDLNRPGDLKWDEIVRLSESMPDLTDLWFSGGEPTLRRELEDIVDLFVRNNGVRHINLPTNGLKPARILAIADRCLARNRDLSLHINIALDGLTDSHDAMRGVPGNFEKAIESARVLRRLKTRFGNRLEVHINTVITRDNIDEILPLAEWIFSEKLVDGHYFNVIRGDARDPRLKAVDRSRLPGLYAAVAEIQARYAERLTGPGNPLFRWIKKAIYVGVLAFHHRTQLENIDGPKAWPMPCTAGETSTVIDFDGRVRACELREPVGDLRKVDMNFKVFWESPERKAETRQIACDQCWCTHVCFIHDSLRYSWRAMLTQIPKNYFLRKAWGTPDAKKGLVSE
jgi:MoaA/NifB/PqqE/SkfB family radical SAM enzyme